MTSNALRNASTHATFLLISLFFGSILSCPSAALAQSSDADLEMEESSEEDGPSDNSPSDGSSDNEQVTTTDQTPESSEPVDFSTTLLQDFSGDGQVEFDAFGDSITRGTGDGFSPGENVPSTPEPSGEAGYPLRIERLLGVSVANLGEPGERLVREGLPRFAKILQSRRTDVIVISGGSNDALDRVSPTVLSRALQTMLNIARARGIKTVLATITPVCCDHDGIASLVQAYNVEYRERALANEVPLANVNRAFRNTCRVDTCSLLNRPEGLHPNTAGYDVFGEVVAASLLNIDILDPMGPTLLAQALGLPPSSIKTVPNAAPAPSAVPTPTPPPN